MPAPNLEQYNDGPAIGTPPAGTTGEEFGLPGVVSPFNPAFDTDQIVVIGQGGQLTVQFPSPIAAGSGPQIGIFSNVGLVDANYPAGVATSPASYFGGGQACVDVSQDGTHWFSAGLGTFDIPENFYLNAGPYDVAPPQSPQTADFSQAFTGTLNSFDGESDAQIVSTLNGSAGGSWVNLYASGVSQINYLRISEPQSLPSGSYIAIEAVSVSNTLSAVPTWTAGNGNWDAGANWSTGSAPQTIESVAVFGPSSAVATISLNGNRAVGNLVFSSTNSYTLAPAGTLVLDNGPLPANVQVSGHQTISAPVVAAGDLAISGPGTLSLTSPAVLNGNLCVKSGATLDITSAGLTFNYTTSDPVTSIAAALATGYANNTWTGDGIDSSSAAADPSRFSVGYLDTGSQVLVQYTLAGDALLQDSVGFADLILVAQHYGQTGWDWAGGNFNYDPAGSVGFFDLITVAKNYGLSLNGGGGSSDVLSAAWTTSMPLPEPSAAAIGLGLLVSLPRRRNQTRSKFNFREKIMQAKITVIVLFVSLFAAASARAGAVDSVTFNDGSNLTVLGDYGSGADTAYMAVDFKSGPDYAWQFNWDPATTVNGFQMLETIAGTSILSTSGVSGTTTVANAAGDPNLTVTAEYFPSFTEHLITNFQYGSTLGVNEWSFFTGTYSFANVSPTNPQGMTWTSPGVGIDEVNLSNDEFIGWVDISPHAPKPILPSTAVPEPAFGGMAVIVLAGLLAGRSGRRMHA